MDDYEKEDDSSKLKHLTPFRITAIIIAIVFSYIIFRYINYSGLPILGVNYFFNPFTNCRTVPYNEKMHSMHGLNNYFEIPDPRNGSKPAKVYLEKNPYKKIGYYLLQFWQTLLSGYCYITTGVFRSFYSGYHYLYEPDVGKKYSYFQKFKKIIAYLTSIGIDKLIYNNLYQTSVFKERNGYKKVGGENAFVQWIHGFITRFKYYFWTSVVLSVCSAIIFTNQVWTFPIVALAFIAYAYATGNYGLPFLPKVSTMFPTEKITDFIIGNYRNYYD